jgi:site-specific recombinase XerD
MIYFKEKPIWPKTSEEIYQLGLVFNFRRDFPPEGLWSTYTEKSQFVKLVRNHLTQFIRTISVSDGTSNNSNAKSKAPTHNAPPVEEQIAQWMQDIASNSIETNKTYKRYITKFRDFLHKYDLDLNSEDTMTISPILQEWAGQAERKTAILPKTYNQRISSIRSFYNFALTKNWMKTNPIEMVEMREDHTFNAAEPLEVDKVKNALKSIPRSTPTGKRDYALLCILLTTGGRAAEIANLRCGHIAETESSITITTRQKGGKEMRYTLKKYTAQALRDYLAVIYGNEYSPDDPVWISYARNGTKGFAISKQALSDICKKWLGTSKVDATRLTYFAIKDEYGIVGIDNIEIMLGIKVEEDKSY